MQNRALTQRLSDLESRMPAMEKRQRWNGAVQFESTFSISPQSYYFPGIGTYLDLCSVTVTPGRWVIVAKTEYGPDILSGTPTFGYIYLGSSDVEGAAAIPGAIGITVSDAFDSGWVLYPPSGVTGSSTDAYIALLWVANVITDTTITFSYAASDAYPTHDWSFVHSSLVAVPC